MKINFKHLIYLLIISTLCWTILYFGEFEYISQNNQIKITSKDSLLTKDSQKSFQFITQRPDLTKMMVYMSRSGFLITDTQTIRLKILAEGEPVYDQNLIIKELPKNGWRIISLPTPLPEDKKIDVTFIMNQQPDKGQILEVFLQKKDRNPADIEPKIIYKQNPLAFVKETLSEMLYKDKVFIKIWLGGILITSLSIIALFIFEPNPKKKL